MTVETKAKPKIKETELDKLEKQFDAFDQNVQQLTQDRMNMAPVEQKEPQTKIAQVDLEKMKDIYLKPSRAIGCKEKFNEKWRDDYNFKKEYVNFTAENHEIIGDSLELWTRPFPGLPAEQWKVPVNTPVWGPRYLAEQIKGCKYHRLKMQNRVNSQEGVGEFYGTMAVDTTVQRLDANPVTKRKSIFMGAEAF